MIRIVKLRVNLIFLAFLVFINVSRDSFPSGNNFAVSITEDGMVNYWGIPIMAPLN